MDAKSIWISAIERTNYSTTHRLMNKKPIRSSYKTQAGFDRALKKWNDSNKPKNPVKKKTVAKKPVAKKPVAKKPVAKKPVAKKPAGKVPAKKPLISNKNKLRIKKGVKTTVKTAKQVVKKAGEVKKTVGKKVTAAKKTLTKKASTPRPKTRLQKLTSKANKGIQKAGRYAKQDLAPNVRTKLTDIGKGIVKKGGLVRGIKNAGLSIGAERLTNAAQKRIAKATTKRGRNQTFKEFDADFTKMKREKEVIPTAKRTLKGIGNVLTGRKFTKNNKTLAQKLNEERVKRQKDKPTTNKKVTSNKNNKKLKVNKKDDRSPTQTNPNNKTKVTSKPKKMHAIEKRNRKIFGDAHVDKLKAKHAAFKERRKKKKTLFR
jgi:histone H1/5